jgi:FtsP/CotA-like multicopper oxidase with cupredoxin domain
VEDWTVENHTSEEHAFHMHQIHFLVVAMDGKPVANPQLRDTINVPYWSGSGPFHSVTLRMDFRDPNIAGTFVFHCHVLFHEDGGMMGKVQVDP